MYLQRKPLLRKLEKQFGFKSILYVTGDRPSTSYPVHAQIHEDVLPLFLDHLDRIGKVDHIGLVLYSRGGGVIAGWSIVNLMRQFCKKLTVVVPFRAQSTATLICLGADSIVMTKQANLGPIDPSTNSPFNPIPPGFSQPVPLSVEDLATFLHTAEGFHLGAAGMTQALLKLCDNVNPIAIGNVYRARNQIRQLAGKLLELHENIPQDKKKQIISVLCEDAGSHDYTIHRREAIQMGLNIQKPDDQQYKTIKSILDDFENELQLRSSLVIPPPPLSQTTSHSFISALLETPGYKSHTYCQDIQVQSAPPGPGIQPGQLYIQPIFLGWR